MCWCKSFSDVMVLRFEQKSKMCWETLGSIVCCWCRCYVVVLCLVASCESSVWSSSNSHGSGSEGAAVCSHASHHT